MNDGTKFKCPRDQSQQARVDCTCFFFIEVSLFFLCLEAISVNVYSCSSRIRFVLLFAEAILIVGTF